jgi:hypothetical protein
MNFCVEEPQDSHVVEKRVHRGPRGRQGKRGPRGHRGIQGATGCASMSTPCFFEDFITGGVSSGTIGSLGWSISNEPAVYLMPEKDHPGILELHYPQRLFCNTAVFADDDFELEMVLRFPGPETKSTWQLYNQDGSILVYTTQNSYLQVYVTNGEIMERLLLRNIRIQAGLWYKIRIVRQDGKVSITAYAQSGVSQTLTTQNPACVPRGPLSFEARPKPDTMHIDAISLRFFHLNR